MSEKTAPSTGGAAKKEKQCRLTGTTFEVRPDEERLYGQFGCEVPDLAPGERLRLLLAFQNTRNFFWRKCKKSGVLVYSNYSPENQRSVFEAELWKEKRRSGAFFQTDLEYSQREQFFEQLILLFKAVPRPAVHAEHAGKMVGCTEIYTGERLSFVSSSARVRDSFTSALVRDSSGTGDSLYISNSERCYRSFDVHSSYGMLFTERCHGCRDCYFAVDCRDCDHLLFCSGLSGKSYHVDNSQVSPAEFEQAIREIELRTRAGVERAGERMPQLRSENTAANGDQSDGVVDCSNVRWVSKAEHCADLAGFCEDIKESVLSVSCGGGARRIMASAFCWEDLEEIYYSAFCSKSRELIGCVGLENAEYCVFNKQYAKADYERLKEEIIGSMKKKRTWGRPLGFKFADFPYNHSRAQDLYPLTKVQSSLLEVEWDEQFDIPQPSRLLASDQSLSRLADTVSSVDEGLRQRDAIYLCELSGAAFQYLPGELELCDTLGVCPSPFAYEERTRQGRQQWNIGKQ